jgi:Family of unknown function (DUF5985)
MRPLLHGAMAMGNLVVGLFFLRFHRDRRDVLFLLFGIAFWLFAANNVVVAFVDAAAEATVGAYVIRLVGFALIIAAIVQKNRAR